MNHSYTVQLVSQWADIMKEPQYNQYRFFNNKQLTNRDITYFNHLKMNHHYIYYGRNEEEVDVKVDIGREELLERIASWNSDSCHPIAATTNKSTAIDNTTHVTDDEFESQAQTEVDTLTYARNGWKRLEPGWLICTQCGKLLVERHVPINVKPTNSTTSDDENKISGTTIHNFIINEMFNTHDSSCFWKYYSFDLNNYYLRPYSQNLISTYLTNLKLICDNYLILNRFTVKNLKHFSQSFINNSNKSLPEIKENFFPNWVYNLALLNWKIHFKHHNQQFIVWLDCNQCNARVFLRDSFDPYSHKPWCCIINKLSGTNWLYYNHLEKLVENLNLDDDIANNNLSDSDNNDVNTFNKIQILDKFHDLSKLSNSKYSKLLTVSSSKKRKHEVNIEENLEKLKKLRTFFFDEEVDRKSKLGYK